MGVRILACHDEPLPLFLAATQLQKGDRFEAIRSESLLKTLERWARDESVESVLILTESLKKEPAGRARGGIRYEALAERLSKLRKRGIEVTWCYNERLSVVADALETLEDDDGIKAFSGTTLTEAVRTNLDVPSAARFRLFLESFERRDSQIEAYIRARLAIAEMESAAGADEQGRNSLIARLLEDLKEKFPDSTRFPTAREQELLNLFEGADHYLEGGSKKIADLKRLIRQVAATDLNALIIGETGTGKEATAFFLHALSRRRDKKFRAVNCAGIDEKLMHSQLFGHEKGAFTGAMEKRTGLVQELKGGTIFLDEIGELSPTLQAALLRFIQFREFTPLGSNEVLKTDVRFIFAGQPSLFEKLRTRAFREDFFFRIAEVQLRTPSLREMGDDFDRVFRHLVLRACRGTGKPHHAILEKLDGIPGAWEKIRACSWPGNVRQLAGFIKRLVVLDRSFEEEWAELEILDQVGSQQPGLHFPKALENLPQVDDLLAEYIHHVDGIKGTIKEKCEQLGIVFNTFQRHLKAYEKLEEKRKGSPA